MQDAEAYLAQEYDNLPPCAPDEFSYPGSAWGEPAQASWVSVEDNSKIAQGVQSNGSYYVPTSNGSDAETERLYQEAKNAPIRGYESISYMHLTQPERPGLQRESRCGEYAYTN